MGFRHWITKNASKTAEAVVVQTKEAFQKKALNRISSNGNVYATIGRLLSVGLLVFMTLRELALGDDEKRRQIDATAQPNTITINNYIHELGKEKTE